MWHRVIAFDPGGTTGYAVIMCRDGYTDEFGWLPARIEVQDIGEFPLWKRVGELIQRLPIISCDTHIVYEKFQALSPDVQHSPVEVIGVIKYVADDHGYLIKGQMPSDRKFVHHRWHKFLEGFSSHHKDALMHALAYVYHELKITGDEITYLRKCPLISK